MPAHSKKTAEDRHIPETEAQVDDLAQEVANALRYLGGAAHRDRVVDCVGAFRRQRGAPIEADLRARIIATFERHCEDWSPVDQALFFLPHGPGSHRWALSANSRGRA